MSRLRSLRQQMDVLRGRYEGVRVESSADRDECLQVLDEVRRVELNRVKGRSVLESAAFIDVDVDDVLIAVRDTAAGRIVGCVRSTPAPQIASIRSSREEYQIDKFPPELLSRTQVLTRFALLRSYRSSAASYVIMREMYRDSLARGLLISLQSCEPGLYASYLRLGFRPLGPEQPLARPQPPEHRAGGQPRQRSFRELGEQPGLTQESHHLVPTVDHSRQRADRGGPDTSAMVNESTALRRATPGSCQRNDSTSGSRRQRPDLRDHFSVGQSRRRFV